MGFPEDNSPEGRKLFEMMLERFLIILVVATLLTFFYIVVF